MAIKVTFKEEPKVQSKKGHDMVVGVTFLSAEQGLSVVIRRKLDENGPVVEAYSLENKHCYLLSNKHYTLADVEAVYSVRLG